jgi:hypothetical protein
LLGSVRATKIEKTALGVGIDFPAHLHAGQAQLHDGRGDVFRGIRAASKAKEPRRASLTPDTQYATSKIFSTLQLEAPALLTLCPAQQTECHHVQHPIRLSWKPIESSISDNHGNIVLNYEVALPEGTYSVQATENSHTHRFGGYVVSFKSKEGHIRHLSTHARRAKWAKEMAANDYRILRGYPVRSRFRRKDIAA